MARDDVGPTAAVRVVAAELGRSEATVRSAYYAGRRAAAEVSEAEPDLFNEMLPLVEAGLSPLQAARRVGDHNSADHLAQGFRRWLAAGGGSAPAGRRRAGAEARIEDLEDENRRLRDALETAQRALARIADIADDAR